jgi:hypothetical protein
MWFGLATTNYNAVHGLHTLQITAETKFSLSAVVSTNPFFVKASNSVDSSIVHGLTPLLLSQISQMQLTHFSH